MHWLSGLKFLELPAVIFLLVMAGQIYFLVVRMSKPERMFYPAVLTPQGREIVQRFTPWLTSAGLEERCTYKFGQIVVVVFQHGTRARYLSLLFHQRITWSAESYGEDLTILDTSNSGSPYLFPRPRAYRQSFRGASVEDVWRRHLEGEAYLTQKFGYQWASKPGPYEELLLPAIRLRMNYVRSQFLWPFKVAFRYFVAGRLHENRTIAQQFP
jgi:hypothetical protein